MMRAVNLTMFEQKEFDKVIEIRGISLKRGLDLKGSGHIKVNRLLSN